MNTCCTLSFHRAFFFTETSRFNHSCSPNAMVAWNEETETKAIKSISNINIGEEITVNYDWQELNMKVYGILPICKSVLKLQKSNYLQNFSARQSYLSKNWGFECQCELCKVCIFIRWK